MRIAIVNPTRIGSLSKERLEGLQQISSTKKKIYQAQQ